MEIEKIDSNFAVKVEKATPNAKIYNAAEPPFSLHGIIPPTAKGEPYHRLPLNVAAATSEGVSVLNLHCAGGRVRFRTDSRHIGVTARMHDIGRMSHFALSGSAGFDLYSGKQYRATLIPQYGMTDEFSGTVTADTDEMTDWTLNLPLYSGMYELLITLDKDASLESPTPYTVQKPVVFYGSSITQGGCASRAGNSYSAMLSRQLDFDYINLGFSGNARGESSMREYIASLDMSAFVLDYDHNAPSTEHFRATHEPMLRAVRKAHPGLPILCVTRPFEDAADAAERRDIIKASVDNAIALGDSNVHFLDMASYMRETGVADEAAVDGTHPNDLGFYMMSRAIEPFIKTMLKL